MMFRQARREAPPRAWRRAGDAITGRGNEPGSAKRTSHRPWNQSFTTTEVVEKLDAINKRLRLRDRKPE
jgi:hypothetical protein